MRIEPEKRHIKYDKDPDVLKISKATTIESGDLTLTTGDLVLSAGDITQTGDLAVTGDIAITGGPLTQTVQYATVADPGDGMTITPPADTPRFYCPITTAGSETRVLGAPDHLGQVAILRIVSDGGSLAMTNASGWKGGTTSDDVATFAEAEDVMICVAAGLDAVDWRWIADVGVTFA
jgi:hypothetical protein